MQHCTIRGTGGCNRVENYFSNCFQALKELEIAFSLFFVINSLEYKSKTGECSGCRWLGWAGWPSCAVPGSPVGLCCLSIRRDGRDQYNCSLTACDG